LSKAVVPDPEYTETLGRADIELEIVSDHPGLLWRDAKDGHGVAIDLFLRLSCPEFFLDLNVLETVFKTESLNLLALRFFRTIGYESEPDALSPQRVDCLKGAWEDQHLAVASLVESIGDVMRDPARPIAKLMLKRSKCAGAHVPTALAQGHAPVLVPPGIRPENAELIFDRFDDVLACERFEPIPERSHDLEELRLALPIVNKGSVKVEENGARSFCHKWFSR